MASSPNTFDLLDIFVNFINNISPATILHQAPVYYHQAMFLGAAYLSPPLSPPSPLINFQQAHKQ